jgi:hypothetical protein
MATTPIPISGGMFQTPAATSAPGVVNPLSTNPTGVQGGSTTASGAPMLTQSSPATMGAAPAAPKANAQISTAPGTVGGSMPSGTTAAGTSASASPVGMPTTATSTLSNLLGTAGSGTPGNAQTATGENNQTITGGTQTSRDANRTLGELQSYYGEGMGSYIYGLMQTGGINETLLNQVDTSQIAAMQPQINSGQANLNSVLGAQGVSGNSSTAALANSNYLSNATTQENAQISSNYLQQYDQGQQLLQSILGNVMQTNQQGTANQPTGLGIATSALGLAGTGAQALSAGISAASPSSDTGALDALAAFA